MQKDLYSVSSSLNSGCRHYLADSPCKAQLILTDFCDAGTKPGGSSTRQKLKAPTTSVLRSQVSFRSPSSMSGRKSYSGSAAGREEISFLSSGKKTAPGLPSPAEHVRNRAMAEAMPSVAKQAATIVELQHRLARYEKAEPNQGGAAPPAAGGKGGFDVGAMFGGR